jgi:DeoR family transcriptional regulator, fructose operon transcriptional repressor
VYAEERQQAMATLVAGRGRVSVLELAEEFAVTTETVRRDLSALERLNLLHRVHGGALAPGNMMVLEAGLVERDVDHQSEKQRIAAAASQLVPASSATILIDAGSTTAWLADALPYDQQLTVFTHSVSVAYRLAGRANVDLHMLPGRVRKTTFAAVGEDTVAALARIRADVAFMATNALSLSHGFSTPDTAEAAIKEALLRSALRTIMLADSTKFGQERTVRFASLEDIDVLVTDAIDEPLRQAVEDAGAEVMLA